MNIKRLYHGSIHSFDQIDISKGKGFKDFGKGFYAAVNKEHAIRLAKRNKRHEEIRFRQARVSSTANAYLYTFELDVTALSNFAVKFFDFADKDWIFFVAENRFSPTRTHNFDVVIGPTADDDTALTLDSYRSGLFGDPQSYSAIETAIRLLESNNLPVQWYFGSHTVVSYLQLKGRVAL